MRFRWGGGKRFGFREWRQGLRPVRKGRRWVFEPKREASRGYPSFRRYLGFMFSWTGTVHQVGEPPVKPMDPGLKRIATPLWRPFQWSDLRRFRF
jgi:hypothetical protein